MRQIKGQLETLSKLCKDLTKADVLSADFRFRGGDYGEDKGKAVFKTVGGFLVVLLFTTNVVDSQISEAAFRVLQSSQLVNEDDVEYGGLMPGDVVPRPITSRDQNIYKAIRDDSDKNLEKVPLDAANDDHVSSFVDEDYRTMYQVALEENRSRTRAMLDELSKMSKCKLPTSVHDLRATNSVARARPLPGDAVLGTMLDQLLLLMTTEHGKVEGLLATRHKALNGSPLELLVDQRLCDLPWGVLNADEQAAADAAKVAAAKAARRGATASAATSSRRGSNASRRGRERHCLSLRFRCHSAKD